MKRAHTNHSDSKSNPSSSTRPSRAPSELATLVAEDLMTPEPMSLRVTKQLREAYEALADADVRHLPIVNADGEPVGILSDRDFRGLRLDSDDALDRPISTLMSSDVLTVDAETSIKEIVSLLIDQKVGAVPVVDADGLLVGIVSYIDLLRALEEQL